MKSEKRKKEFAAKRLAKAAAMKTPGGTSKYQRRGNNTQYHVAWWMKIPPTIDELCAQW